MSCAPFDLQDYYFEVLPQEQLRDVGEHVAHCQECAAELERLKLTALALAALPDEEIPRRIGFVSDKVFEPSPMARWWQALWTSGGRLASASMALLAVAILIHAFRPQPAPVIATNPVHIAATPTIEPAALQAAVDRAVAKAVSATEVRYDAKLNQIMADNAKQKLVIERAAEQMDAMDRRARAVMVADNRESPGVNGQ